MKTKVFMLICLAACILLTGCLSANSAKWMRELGNDPATFTVDGTSIYGRLRVVRTNPDAKGTTTISPDGTIVIKRE